MDDGSDKAKAFEMGGDDYIAKPFNIKEVLARVKYQLDLQQRQARLRKQTISYRLASHELRRAYSFIQDVLNSLPGGIAVFQPMFDQQSDVYDFKLVIANTAFLRLVNETSSEVLGNEQKTLHALTANHSECKLFELCRQVIESEAADKSIQQDLLCFETPHKQQWIKAFASKLQDSVVISLCDISDSKSQISALEAMKQELYTLATTDVLTQVGNRYRFDSYFATEWERSLREQQPLSLMMVDVDKFKRFNDVCGHSVGDRCLQAVAQTLASVVKRPADLVARYGGEEFAIVLPDTSLAGAICMANAIQSKIRALRLPDVSAVECEQVRLSIGISCTVPQIQQASIDLLEAADSALYRAKSLGGNRNCDEIL